ncbi:MAG: hypothetical protein U0324_06830 [Polyangiales bacterium]
MLASLREFFTLRAAESRATGLTPESRDRALARLRLARQRDDAARDLWLSGHRAEGLRLAREALGDVLAAAEAVGLDDAPARALMAGELPALDAEVAGVHAEAFRATRRACGGLDRALAPVLDAPRDRAVRRALRAGLAGAATLALVAGMVAWKTRPPPPRATASGHHPEPPGFGPEKVLDGDAYTEWLLPPYTTGWLDLTFARPRTLAAVRLLNGHNRASNDMAVRDYRVEAFAGARSVANFQGTFPTLEPEPAWYRVPLAAAGVTRVRVWVDGYHRAGGGLAEVDFE